MSQQENGNLLGARLDALKRHHCVTWGELAGIVKISRAMLDYVRKGEKEPGPKVLRRIIEAERAAGILAPEHPPILKTMAALERMARSSKDWKDRDELFQALETRLEQLLEEAQSVITELRELRERKG